MPVDREETIIAKFPKGITVTLGLPLFEILGEIWRIGRKLMRGLANEGMYEVLDYASTLELLDNKGRKATFKKKMKIRYLQDETIAFQDFAWGDGVILVDYKTRPGLAVDQHRSGYKTYILLSLREVKNGGDIDDYNISWGIRNGFLTPDGYWSTEISHRMKRVRVNVIFPRRRPPHRVFLEENNRRRSKVLDEKYWKRLSDGRWRVTWEVNKPMDGRWRVTWEVNKPMLFENYVIRWDW
jgi:hypothetical protein